MTQIGTSLLVSVSQKIISEHIILPDRHLVDRLCEKFPKAGKSAKSSERAFAALDDTADRSLAQVWGEQEASALLGRNVCPESMDIYDIKIQKGFAE